MDSSGSLYPTPISFLIQNTIPPVLQTPGGWKILNASKALRYPRLYIYIKTKASRSQAIYTPGVPVDLVLFFKRMTPAKWYPRGQPCTFGQLSLFFVSVFYLIFHSFRALAMQIFQSRLLFFLYFSLTSDFNTLSCQQTSEWTVFAVQMIFSLWKNSSPSYEFMNLFRLIIMLGEQKHDIRTIHIIS